MGKSVLKVNSDKTNQEAALGSRRLTITIPFSAYTRLVDRSLKEGRSISNLAALLLEDALLTRNQR